MANILIRPGWHLPEKSITPESIWLNRRLFLERLGKSALGFASLSLTGCGDPQSAAHATPIPLPATNSAPTASRSKYPAPRNPQFNPKWELTEEELALKYNNFYEFSTTKDRVHKLVDKFVIAPWPIEVGGLVENPLRLDLSELIDQMPLEERVYRFRCVEAWSMIVPWTGFPLKVLLENVVPKSDAKFVRFVTFNRPDQAPGMANKSYPWPYTEGLRLDEAMNPLAMIVTGIYGKPLPKQNGAPIRLVVPWKYGYKSIKSIVKIELTATQPSTLWETMAPHEYPFESNVNPAIPHPRWSQATERMLGSGDRVKTQLYNGYGHLVAQLYSRQSGG